MLLIEKSNEYINPISKQELKSLENILDALFKAVDIDIEFSYHFFQRVNDRRNKDQITVAELRQIFQKTFYKYSKELQKAKVDYQAVLNDIQSDLNIPFVIVYDKKNNELDLVSKTVMRKKNFKTSNQKLKV